MNTTPNNQLKYFATVSYFQHSRVTLLLTLCLTCYSPLSAGVNLIEVYELAVKHDPTYQQQIENWKIALEQHPKALSQLLPEIRINANTSSHKQTISTNSGFGMDGKVNFNSHGYNLSLSQPLFRADRWLELDHAELEIARSQYQLKEVKQILMLRVSEHYFSILSRQDEIHYVRVEKKSLQKRLEQAEKYLNVGRGTITDLEEARAGYDRAIAQEINAINQLNIAQEALREIIAEYPSKLSSLNYEMPFEDPIPNDIEQWVNLSLQHNILINQTLKTLEIAKKEIAQRKAGRLPVLDLVASHGYNRFGGRFGLSQTHETEIGIQASIPIYLGGRINSEVRTAYNNYNLVALQLEQTRRVAQRNTRESYLNVLSGISQINALKQALKSSKTALRATQNGFEVGTRTAVDIVNAERNHSSAKLNYSKARYEYLLNQLKLKQGVGSLNLKDLGYINTWLVDTPLTQEPLSTH